MNSALTGSLPKVVFGTCLLLWSGFAAAGIRQQCGPEIARFCQKTQSSLPVVMQCLNKNRSSLSPGCLSYSDRLGGAMAKSEGFKSSCNEDYQGLCEQGPVFKIGVAQKCFADKRDLLSEGCEASFDRYFSYLKKSRDNGQSNTQLSLSGGDSQGTGGNEVAAAASPMGVAGQIQMGKAMALGKVTDLRGKGASALANMKGRATDGLLAKVGLNSGAPGVGSLLQGNIGGALGDVKGSLLKRGLDKKSDLASAAMGKLAGGLGGKLPGKLGKLGEEGSPLAKASGLLALAGLGGGDDDSEEGESKKVKKKKNKKEGGLLSGFLGN